MLNHSILPSSHSQQAIFTRKATPAVEPGTWEYPAYTTQARTITTSCARVVYIHSSHTPNMDKNNKNNSILGKIQVLDCLKKNGILGG